MQLLWGFALASLVVSSGFLARAIYIHRRTRLPLPSSLAGGIALNVGLAFLIVPQFMELPSLLRWLALAVSGLFIVYSIRMSRRALRQVN